MGLDIGTSVRVIASVAPASLYRPDRAAVSGDNRAEEAGRLVRPPEDPPVRAGFGENTLSPSSAALEALDTNLEVAGDLVPTVQELRERARVNQAARPGAIESGAARNQGDVRRLESVRPEPNVNARNFIADRALEPVSAPAASEVAEEAGETGTDQDDTTRPPAPARLDVFA